MDAQYISVVLPDTNGMELIALDVVLLAGKRNSSLKPA